MSLHHVEVPGVTLCVDDIGQGEPLLLLPGMLCDTSLFEAQAHALARHARVLRLDWRGHGFSTGPHQTRWDLSRLVEDVHAVCQSLQLERVNLVGFSLGGMVALRYALAHPTRVRSLALLNTSGGREDLGRRLRFLALSRLAGLLGPHPALTALAAREMFAPRFRRHARDTVVAWRRAIEKLDPGVVRGVVRMVAQRGDVLREAQRLRGLPSLVLSSGRDLTAPPAHGHALARALAAHEVVLADAGHASPLEEPDLVLQVLDGFWRAHGVLPPRLTMALAA
jgi:pimeloyl-ACP methyl ester carboxylesterase